MKQHLLFFLSLLAITTLSAKEETISKTFDAEEISLLNFESKYGELKIENWEKPEIAVDVFIKVQGNKEKTIEKILSNVGVDFNQEGSELKIKTDFGMFFSFMKLSNNLFRSGDFSIDYHIKMPKNIALDIVLHHGNVILFKRDADVNLEHSSGYISLESIHGSTRLKLRDSHLRTIQADSMFLDVKGSNLEIDKVLHLKGESYNSKLHIADMQALSLKSTRDKITLKKSREAFINSSLSSVLIEELQTAAIINASYGDVIVYQIVPEFEELKITGRGADIAINLESTPAHIAVNHHISTKVKIPDSMGLRMKFGESQKEFITTGTIGNPQGTSQLLINTKGGKLELR